MEQFLEQLKLIADRVGLDDGYAIRMRVQELETRVTRLKNLKEDLWVREGSLGWPADMAQGYETACQSVSEQIGEILS